MNELTEEILRLKNEKNAVILAHYYVDGEVQAIADYIGDSYYLSKVAASVEAEMIVFCGVSFMGEGAKILNPNKMVLLPDETADCPMAHMADAEKIKAMREQYDNLAVVCYINSTAELKTYSDVCVTSSNAVDIVKALPNTHIYFIPDENLGRYVAGFVPEKTFLYNEGFCPIHKEITYESVKRMKEEKPDAKILVHPECTMDVLELADYVGSTSGIIEYAGKSETNEFIICTEKGILYELQMKDPDKSFYFPMPNQCCMDMKKITLEKVKDALKQNQYEVHIDEEIRVQAEKPLSRMLELAK